MPANTGRSYADYYPRRSNAYVANMIYHSDVTHNGYAQVEYNLLPAGAADAIHGAADLVANVRTPPKATFNSSIMGPYGRNVVAAVGAVTVRGRDYLGQPMSEDVPVGAGKKAFKTIDSITCVAGATAATVGTGNVLGLPFHVLKVVSENVDDGTLAAGTFVAPVAVQNATSGDPRGTYLPAAGGLPNGARRVLLEVKVLQGNLHGVKHFAA